MPTGIPTSSQKRKEVEKAIASGMTLKEAAESTGVKYNTLNKWNCSRRKLKLPFSCGICDVQITEANGLRNHFRNYHPELRFHLVRDGQGTRAICKCGLRLPSFSSKSIQKHIHFPAPTATTSQTISSLDSLLEQVYKNTELFKQEQLKTKCLEAKNAELLTKLTQYATKIVELQNQITLTGR